MLVCACPPAAFAEAVEDTGGLLAEAAALESVDAKRALAVARRAIDLAASPHDRLRATFETASILRRLGEYAEAMSVARSGLDAAERADESALVADFLYLVGRIHWNQTDYAASIETHLRQLDVATRLADPLLISRAHAGLGLTFVSFGQSENAYQHLNEALTWARRAGDPRQLSIVLNALGNYHYAARELPLATSFHEQALALRRQTGSVRGVADSLNNLALIAHASGDSPRALELFAEARAIYERLGLKRYVANVHRRIGATLRETGQFDAALRHLETGLAIASDLGSAEVLINLYQELTLTHEGRHDFARALEFERLRARATEDARTVQDRERIAELNARYEAERREHEIDLLRRDQALQTAEIRRRRLVAWFLAAGLTALAIISAAAVVFQRSRLRQERRLHAATEDARDRAEEAEQLKSRLLQIASHDLKAPLSALRATASRIESEASPASRIGRLAAGMRVDATRMDLLVHDLLDSVAIQSHRFQLNRTTFDLAELCAAVVEHLQPVAGTKAQSLSVQRAGDVTLVEADRGRLWQILDNLVSNALKFTPREGRIIVRVARVPDWFTVEVEDNGPGLAPADLARVFGPYQQLSARPTGDEDSTGLGLHITRELVAMHDGRLEVESQPGRGAIFRVLLPDGRSAEAALQAPAHERGDVVQPETG